MSGVRFSLICKFADQSKLNSTASSASTNIKAILKKRPFNYVPIMYRFYSLSVTIYDMSITAFADFISREATV